MTHVKPRSQTFFHYARHPCNYLAFLGLVTLLLQAARPPHDVGHSLR